MKAVTKFKALLGNRRPELRASVLGDGVRIVHPPLFLNESSNYARSSKSVDLDDRRPVNTALTAEGVHRDLSTGVSPAVTMLEKENSKETTDAAPLKANAESAIHHQGHHTSGEAVSVPHPGQAGSRTRTAGSVGEKGHAHDPMDDAPLWLGIGASSDHVHLPDVEILADSPTAAEFNIYNTAYQEEVERIRAAQGHETTLYLNRRVDSKQQYKADPNMLDAPSAGDVVGKPHQGWKGVLDAAREKEKALKEGEPISTAEKTDKGPPLKEEAVVEEGTHENGNHENVTPERVTPGDPASNSNVDSSQGPSREKRKLSTKIGSAFKGAMQKVKMTKTPEKVDEAMEDAK
jgi:[calcium/calmodulin-dependent protein kinase] kinase